jgi:hypothetical protein
LKASSIFQALSRPSAAARLVCVSDFFRVLAPKSGQGLGHDTPCRGDLFTCRVGICAIERLCRLREAIRNLSQRLRSFRSCSIV